MTLTQVHQAVMAVVQRIVTDHTEYPLLVESENRSIVDQAGQTRPYLQVTIEVLDAEQASLGPRPQVKHVGQILLAAVVKDGAGTLEAKALLDFAMPYFSTLTFGTLQCQAAKPTRGREVKGWWYQPAIVPFFYFQQLQK